MTCSHAEAGVAKVSHLKVRVLARKSLNEFDFEHFQTSRSDAVIAAVRIGPGAGPAISEWVRTRVRNGGKLR